MDDTGAFPDDASIPPETVLWRLINANQTFVDPNTGRRVPLPPAYDDNPDGEPMSAFIATECDDPEALRRILAGTHFVVKFTADFARSLGLRIVRHDIPEAKGHVVIAGGMREKVDHKGKRRRRQWIFSHAFNPDEDWVIAPPDA